MDAIERDLRTYGGVIGAAETRAAGIRALIHHAEDKTLRAKLGDRGIDETDATHFEESAATLKQDLEHMRALWAQLQQLSHHLHDETNALADDIRTTDDAARSALGRKSAHLPTLGIKPIGRRVKRAKLDAPPPPKP